MSALGRLLTFAQHAGEVRLQAVAPDAPEPMLREEQLLSLIPVARTTLYRMIKDGRFPRGVFVSPNRRLWLASEVAA